MKTKHFLITLLMCCVSISMSAESWTDANGTAWNFSTSGENATVTGISGTIPNELMIPSTVYIGETAYTVTTIAKQAFFGEKFSSVTVPASVTFIGSIPFYNCSNLHYVHLQSSTPVAEITNWNAAPIKIVFFVPDEAVETYRTAWTNMSRYVVPESSSSVREVTVTATEESSAIIDAIGEEHAFDVVKLKVHGTFNGYDIMAFRNKMINLRDLDLSDAHVVSSPYKYYKNCNSKDNVITGYFVPETLLSFRLPADIQSLEAYAFYKCDYLKTVTLPEGIPYIPAYAFYFCSSLSSVNIPESVVTIGNSAFDNYINSDRRNLLTQIHLPYHLQSIGNFAFRGNEGLTDLRLPPYIENIGNQAFMNCEDLKDIYAYMPDVIEISTNTFDYTNQNLYVPEFLYKKYYYDTNWSQFANIVKINLSPDDYLKIPTGSDVVWEEDDERVPDTSTGEHVDGELKPTGSFTVEGNEPQPFDEIEQNLDGEGQGGSLIADGGDGDANNNMPVNTLKVKIQVKANRWYFFCFPYDVTIASCEYPGQYAWREYDGSLRALNGANGWKTVEGTTLTARQGYIFQSATAGTLVVNFDHPTFGGNRPKALTEYLCDNAANASWNFVGNPYSCFYDFDDNDFDAPITVWNGTSYQAYRPGDDDYHLQPYEAFFVQKPSGTDEIGFEKERRETYCQSEQKKIHQANTRRAKGIAPERLLINLTITDDETEAIDRTRLVLNEKASRQYELECDAAKFISNDAKAQLYMVENGVQMAINERPESGDIRLGYMAKERGTLRIEAPRMDLPMLLLDTKKNITFDLSLGAYEFETEAGTNNTRFMLLPSNEATAIKDLTAKTGVAIGLQDGGLSIGGAEGKSVAIYNTNGAQVAQQSGNGFVGLPSGMYIVKVANKSAKVYVK